MKNSEIKRKLSSLFTSPATFTPNAEEIQKIELETEISKVEKMLTHEYSSLTRSKSREDISKFDEEKFLKSSLNKLRSSNLAKTSKINGLIDLINFYSAISPKNMTLSTQNSNFHFDNEVDELKQQISEEETKIHEEESNTEVLVEKKNKIIQSSLIWKERLLVLTKVHREVDKKYAEAIDTKKKALLSLFTVQNDLAHLEKFKDYNKQKFLKAIDKGKDIKTKNENLVRRKIENISRSNLDSRRTINERKEVLKTLQEKISNKNSQSNLVKLSIQEINLIKNQLEIIKNHIPDCPDFKRPLTAANINFITSSYAKMKFQELSLSIKFQNLTEEQLDKQQKCDIIRKELLMLKAANEGMSKSNSFQNLTFNQIKSSMENDNFSSNSEFFEETQKLAITIYLQLLNLSTLVCRAINIISQNSVNHHNDNSFVYSSNIIKKAQQGFITRHDKDSKEISKKITFKENKKTFKTEVENLDDLMNFSISLYEIQEILGKFLNNPKNLQEIAVIIKSDHITCFFVDIPDIELRLHSQITKPKNLIIELNCIGNAIFKEKFQQIAAALQDILQRIKFLDSESRKEFNDSIEGYKKRHPDKIVSIIEKLEMLNKPFLIIKHQSEIAEKLSPAKILKNKPDEICELNNPYKAIDNVKNSNEEKSNKSRQDLPMRPEKYSKTSPEEIMSELNNFRNKVSELRSLERKVNSTSQREFLNTNVRKPWFKPDRLFTSQSSNRPLTVNFSTNSTKRSNK